MTIRIPKSIVSELGCYNCAGRNTMSMFERSAEFGDTRRATVSTADAYDGGIALLLNFRP